MTNDSDGDRPRRTVLVTGSSRGIGAAIAEEFAATGARVVLHGRDESALAEVQQRITTSGGTCSTVQAELTNPAAVSAMIAQIRDDVGPVDVLVANAGGSPVRPGPVEELADEGWQDSIAINLTATFYCIRAVLPSMKDRGTGTIITMSSAAARRPDARSPVGYAAAKAGIELLTQAVAAQAGPSGVRACCLAPETILTERNSRQIPADLQESLAAEHPLRRLGTPQDVAQAAVFLASDQASWITGVVLDVAGGAVLN